LTASFYGAWAFASLISKSGLEAFGIGMSTWMRKRLLDRTKNFETTIAISIYTTIGICTIGLIGFHYVLYSKLCLYFPILDGYKILCELFIISSEIQLIFSILNSQNLYHSDLRDNFRWAGLVLFTSPVFIFLVLKRMEYGALFITMRDSFFLLNTSQGFKSRDMKILSIFFISTQIGFVIF
jgi:hypothetical protein